jgi:hypothetical protein
MILHIVTSIFILTNPDAFETQTHGTVPAMYHFEETKIYENHFDQMSESRKEYIEHRIGFFH